MRNSLVQTCSRLAVLLLAVASAPTSRAAEAGASAGGLEIGPRLSLIAGPAPNVGVEARIARVVGFTLDYGMTPWVRVEDVDCQLAGWRAGARLYPFRGRFFVGGALGQRYFTARETVTYGASAGGVTVGVTGSGTLDVTSTYLAPEMGWRFVWDNGFFMGIDLGWQFVIAHEWTLRTNAWLSNSDRSDVEKWGRRIGKAGLPEVGLLQVGLFL